MEIKYILHCPQVFANDRYLWAFDDEKAFIEISRLRDDGMAYTWEEISESEARKHYFRNDEYSAMPKINYLPDNELIDYPNWEEAKQMLVKSSKNYYEYISQYD